jgi:hypothetical protein
MIVSKSQGEKLDDRYMNVIYGRASCGGKCGNCDCRSSNGALFLDAYNPSMDEWEAILLEPPQT